MRNLAAPHQGLAGPLSIFVAARDGFIAGRVRQALEREGFQLTFEWGPVAELPRRHRRNIEVVVVVEGDGEETPNADLAAIHTWAPRARVVVICSPRRARPQALLRSRVDAVVVEPGADAVVGPIVRVVLSDYLVVPQSLRTVVDMPALTVHDRELLALVADGLTNREIAERLYLAESTVKRHLSALFRRLGVSSRSEAAATAAVLASDQMFGAGPGRAP
jgi:DNA-binding NarL/FixJ family response regulator